ncbi:transcription activator effector binding protein (plasmid) [Gemmatirosa kalamazoonensis]|uniref:Transcription activator effector binding protein n=1 Tax=Gemmatirosa kalamazoonensis TaxID=861299 RepID=W0RPT9_9BACT|nr:GyrI-like domain-containing protein [Gemmatirosa kalamazoonensis]AHG92355.1 transcription activator effector binding protein [Gemmatirosa kalamazoonensis]
MSSDHPVRLEIATQRGIAAVRAQLPIAAVPVHFAEYLDQVYAAARRGAVRVDGQNIFVYRGGSGPERTTDVEFGVGVAAPFAPIGPVQYAPLPVGEVAGTTHWGDYAELGRAHAAVIEWCRAQGRELTGVRWEVYGHWSDDPAQRRTDVYHLLRR